MILFVTMAVLGFILSSAVEASRSRPGRGISAFYLEMANINIPRHREKRKLVTPARRAPHAMKYLRQHKVTVVTFQELSTISRLRIRASRKWTVVDADPNTVTPTTRISNSVAFRNDIWRMKWYQNHNLPWSLRKRGLNMLTVCLVNRETGEEVRVLSAHAPRRKLYRKMNHAVIRWVITKMQDWDEKGLAAAVGMDGNNPALERMLRLAGISVWKRSGVTVIAAVNMKKLSDDEDEVDFSDHNVVRASGTTKKEKNRG